MTVMTLIDIPISSEFREFIPSAALRLRYIYPNLKIEPTANGVKLSSVAELEATQVEQEVFYQIYREKIFQQTLPMRRDLYKMLGSGCIDFGLPA